MIKGIRMQATNTTTIAPILSGFGMLTVPTGKSFILTDLIAMFRQTVTSGLGMSGIQLMDAAMGAGISATDGIAPKVTYGGVQDNLVGTVAINQAPRTLVVTDLVNGPEFTTCVAAVPTGTYAIPTYGLWISGILR